jgi:hypothetical protein
MNSVSWIIKMQYFSIAKTARIYGAYLISIKQQEIQEVILAMVCICMQMNVLVLSKLHLLQNNIKSSHGAASANTENNVHILEGQELQIKEINDFLPFGENFDNGIGFLEHFN